MRKFKITAAAFVLSLTLIGCAKNTTAPLPTGATNTTDAATFRILSDAHAFLKSIGDSVRAGNLTLNQSEKDAYNKLVASSNAADQLWQQYHAGNSSLAAPLTAATNQLQSDLSSAKSVIGVSQ